jgi:hypothetical protein
MTRPLLLVPALAAAALLMATPAASSSPTADRGTHSASIDISLDLDANHGLQAHVRNFEKITLEIERKGRLVTYEVPGDRGNPGQRGDERVARIGMALPSTQGSGASSGPSGASGAQLSSASEAERVPATLSAFSRSCLCVFLASTERDRRGRGPSTFFGAKFEKHEGMEINRLTYAEAGASAFVFNHAAGTASVRPPHPFTGHAAFRRRPGRRDLWRGAVRVPLLGADPLVIRGTSFRAKLVRASLGE